MKRIIPLIFIVFFSVLKVQAQQLNAAEANLAMKYIGSNMEAIGISSDVLRASIVSSTFEDEVTGIRYVYLQQTYNGIPVHNQMQVMSFRNEKLLSNSGNFDPSIAKLINGSTGIPSVSAESAVQSALSDRGIHASQMAIALNRKDNGRFVEFSNMGVSQENITAKLNWVANEQTKQYELAWQVYLIPKTTPDYWLIQVNALDNRIIGMDNLTVYDNWGDAEQNASLKYPGFAYGINKEGDAAKILFDFKAKPESVEKGYNGPSLADNGIYRVIPIPYEAPHNMPGASTTWHAIRNNPWTNAGVVANAVTLKWHTGAGSTDYNYTRGNNVWAYHDRNNQNVGDPARSATSSTALPDLTFDFTPDYTMEPVVTSPPNQQFNTTNLFYWNNLIHDIFYAYGFTEAGGNFQDDNLGRGGVGNDHVNAEAQDGSGSNNANFSTPADGGSGRMQMYLWTAPTPDRDGDVDNGIIIHEHGHGIGKRVTGGPANTSCLSSSETQGEGISDYFGLMLTQDWSTATVNTGFNSPRGIGTYALNQPPTGVGIRPTRYGTNFADNSTTYANLPGQAIPHGVGYVWCTMLWEMTWELIQSTNTIEPNIYNWNNSAAGNIVALRLVMEGLRTQPCQPGFVDARNAIIQADTTLYGGSHYCAIISAFARRGVGIGALQGAVTSITDQTPSFVGGGAGFAFTQSGAAGVPAGQNIVYNHAITASCATLTNYTLRDTLPANVNFVSATNGGVYTAATRVVAWPVNVPQSTTQNYGLTVQIDPGAYFPPVTLINETVPSTTIPAFWTAASTTANVWIAHNVRSHSAPNSFFTPDAAVVSDQTLTTTNSFALGATPPILSFWHWYNSESGFDGAVLEISLNGGTTWQDIGAANITQNGYNGTISTTFSSPIGGRQAWTGNSAAFIESKVDLTSYANQANVKLRWRFASDVSVSSTGWNVDDILMELRAVVNMRTSLFNASNNRVDIKDTVTVILPGSAVPPNVTINQAAAQPDPTAVSPINFTVVFDQVVTGFTTGDVTLSGTAGATTGIVTGSGTTYNVEVSGMTASGTVIATIAAGVCVNVTNDPNNASTSTDNTVTYNLPPPPPGCITTVAYTGAAVPIPDNTPGGVDIPLLVSGVGTIADLNFMLVPINAAGCDNTIGNVNASITHTWNGDLTFKLTSPAATTVTLIARRGSSGNNFCAVTLDDDGAFPAASTMSTAGAIAGNYAPESPLSAFDGQNANGTWILNVEDFAGGDIGTVNGFALEFTSVAPTMNPVPNDTVCNGGPAGPYNFTSPTPGVGFSWTNSNPTIGLAASGSGNIAAFTAVNTGTAPVTAIVTVTPETPLVLTGSLLAGDLTMPQRLNRPGGAANTCAAPGTFPGTFGTGPYFYDTHTITNATGISRCVTVQLTTTDLINANIQAGAWLGTFNPLSMATNFIADPKLSTGTPAAPAGISFSFNLASGATAVIPVWSANTNATAGGTAANYTLTISGLGGCTGPSQVFNITVNPSGQVNPVANQTLCKGDATAAVNFTSTVPGTIFSWANNNTLIGLAATGQGNIPSFIAQNPTSVQQVATITVTPSYGSGGIQQTQNFSYTGAVQTWVVPAGVTSINVKTWGAQGNSNAGSILGGLGGYAEGTLAVTPGQTLYINAGGGAQTTINGGFNGGGAAGANAGCAAAQGGGGGGASDVRVGANTLGARAIVAAGGGGAGGNRTAGCGRGAGGGGGAGYYGGGGGAGWPGIPPGGPVPTGGTQAAGGAGGVTTFTPGPTNGFPGVLGIGGAGGTEIASAQGTPTGPAEQGGVGGGLTGAPGNYNSANNWNGQSGAGGSSYIGGVTAGVTTSGLNAGNGRVEFTYAAGGLSCAGSQISFTITVNPNADLLIIADPGTVLCEGDPTLLTVYDAAGSTPPGTLYTQGTGTPPNGVPSQLFEPANTAFSSQGADDFTVPAGARWTVTRVTASGINTASGVPTSVNVFIYNNSGSNLPGTAVASYTNLTTFTRTGGNYSIDIPATVLLGGTYWVSIQVDMSFATSGQWFWGNYGATNVGNEAAWQNPGGGFATPCTGWGYAATGCAVGGGANRNLYFSIYGSSVLPGPQSTGTFLWSPAAGLSSTTTNPVAASPLQTTTYTVTRTTVPGCCVASAQITITVNQRPRVTASPANTTVCENGTATFTAAGVATG
ncbi:MAG: M36 family metallopeptidase, partial [Ferruginibacter sp.]